MGNKQEKCEAAGIGSGAAAIGGIALMFLTGPVGIVAGSAALAAGLSGAGNAYQQAKDTTTEDFSTGRFVGHVLVNGTVGAATAGVGTALQGLKAVATLGKAAQVAVQVSSAAATASAASAAGKCATNGIDGKPLSEGVKTAAIAGLLSGGVGAGSGQAIAQNLGKVGQTVAVKFVTGAVSGGASGAATTIVSNLINLGEISKQSLERYLVQQFSQAQINGCFTDLWKFFINKGAVKGEIVTLQFSYLSQIPYNLAFLKGALYNLTSDLRKVQKGLLTATLQGGVIGGACAAVQQIGQNSKNKVPMKELDVNEIRLKQGQPKLAPKGQAPNLLAPDIKTKSGMNKLFNQKVVEIAPLERPLALDPDKSGKISSATGLGHKGVMLKLQDGRYFVVESGKNYAIDKGASIKDANLAGSEMGWKIGEFMPAKQGITVSTVKKAADIGGEYNIFNNNCMDAKSNVMKAVSNSGIEPKNHNHNQYIPVQARSRARSNSSE